MRDLGTSIVNRHFLGVSLVLALAGLGLSEVSGGEAPSATGNSSADNGPVEVRTSIHSAIIRMHKPGGWSVLGLNATNRGDQDGESLISVYFAEDPSRQYARRVWVPAHARRVTWLPIQVPQESNEDNRRKDLRAITLDPTSGREVLQHKTGEPLVARHLIGLAEDAVKSGTCTRRPGYNADPSAPEPDVDAWETLMSARKIMELPESANDFGNDFMPPWPSALNGIGQFMLTSDRIACDSAGLAALRGWVRKGGRLWITLDRVSPSTVQALLGNAASLTIVDRVELDRFTLDSVDESGRVTSQDKLEYDDPVELVRVETTLHDVPCRIQGWPAAIWVPFGNGEVLITALGPRGWRPGEGREATQAWRSIAFRLLQAARKPVDLTAFRPMLQQRIGYRIPSRWMATSVLSSYCLSLLVAGIWLYRRGRVGLLVGVVLIATVVAAGVMVAVGAASTSNIPPTIAYSQLASISAETGEVFSEGLVAVYERKNREVLWSSSNCSLVTPDTNNGLEVRRQVWTGNDTMVTENASTQAASVGLVRMEDGRSQPAPTAVVARFGPSGLEGRFSSVSSLSDPVISGPGVPSLAVKMRSDGTFVSRPDDVLPAGQFIAGSLLSDRQRSRQETMRGILRAGTPDAFLSRVAVAGWYQTFETGMEFPKGFRMDGDSFAVLPLELLRTPADTEFRIPATFLKPAMASDGKGVSSVFNARTGQWLRKLVRGSEANLHFKVPDEVLPCMLKSGKLTVRINAPSRLLSVWSIVDKKRELLKSISSPSGVYDFELKDKHLAIDDTGRVQVVITVGKSAVEAQAEASGWAADDSRLTTWQIEYVRLTLDGRTRQEESRP